MLDIKRKLNVWCGAILYKLGAQQCYTRQEVECGVAGLPKRSMTPCTTQIWFSFNAMVLIISEL